MTTAELIAEAIAVKMLGGDVTQASDIGTHAVEYATRSFAVFPLIGKVPAIRGGRGVLDATTDVATVAGWWGGRYAGCNIGGRVPDSMIVIDIDPRNGGMDAIGALQAEHGPLPPTLTTVSGRGDGGAHLFYRRPHGKLTSRRLGAGVDLKTSTGYVVLPPSIHPDTGGRYVRIDRPVAAPPPWLCELLQVAPTPARPRPVAITPAAGALSALFTGPSIADQFCASATWAQVLEPHGWRCLDADGDADGARWRHPTATSVQSATVRHGCLFVYSPNTPFEVSEPGDPHGYTKFRALAVLNHSGDLSAAAKQLRDRYQEVAA